MHLITQCSNKECNGRVLVVYDFSKYHKFLRKTVPSLHSKTLFFICHDNKSYNFLSETIGTWCPYCGHIWDYQLKNIKDREQRDKRKRERKNPDSVLVNGYLFYGRKKENEVENFT